MTTDVLQDIIARCHQRRENPLKQRRTILTPLPYEGMPYQFTVHCAHRYPVLLQDLTVAGISFMPIGRAPEIDRPSRAFEGERFLRQQQAVDWTISQWRRSWGLQVYTGVPSERNGAPWHDIDFKYEAICAAPEVVLACVQALVNAVANPLLTLTKSGGLRFSCRIPGYLHPSTKQARVYVYKGSPSAENPDHYDAYLEILGEKGYNCWDGRYEILIGNLLDPPVISKEVLFALIDPLRAKLHEPVSQTLQRTESILDAPYSLGSGKLDLAKEAFFKRGFSYLRQNKGVYYWHQYGDESGNTEVSLWENEEGVWVCASASDTRVPMEATLITDVWKDTGILPPIPKTELPIDDKVIAIREGALSPLSLKRRRPVLHKPQPAENVDETPEEISTQVQRAFDRNARVLGVTLRTDADGTYTAEAMLRKRKAFCLRVPRGELAAAAARFLQNQDAESMAQWRDRMYLWDQVKHIPVDVRMATPFQHGNVCEDPERCEALEKKGGDPNEIICPQCPVYTACRERGYLSQPATLQTTNVQISKSLRLFSDPQFKKIADQILEARHGTQSLCIINTGREDYLFPRCELPKTTLKEWVANWQGSALGNFAVALLNAGEIRDRSHESSIKRLRAVVETFEWLAEELIQQMCHVNIPGRVVARQVIDAETGTELARFTIEFEQGISAYIPVDAAAADRLAAEGLPFFRLDAFVPNEDMRIPMSIADAVRLGILDAATVENIHEFPAVCADPHWTFWHQLKRFFTHYTRDANAPMQWKDEALQFRVPSVLHPSAKYLLVNAPALYGEHLRRILLDAETEILRLPPIAWRPGNQVFQIRTGIYPRETILDFNNTSDLMGMSETGQQVFSRIQAEIERYPNVNHGIITHIYPIEQLKPIAKKGNVSFLTGFRELEGLETAFQEAQIIWIVGMPEMGARAILNRTQILFGNDKEPLSYEMEPDTYRYKDARVQNVYEKEVARIFTEIIGLAQLNRLPNKKVMLITGLRIPEITDRPETLLFDWEDFDVAGGLDKLAEVIATRQRFEAKRDTLTGESSRKEVEQVLGCPSRQANRVLQKMRGGKPRVTFREQILALLADGEKTTQEFAEAIRGHPKAINTELTRLVGMGVIVKVRRGVYKLPED